MDQIQRFNYYELLRKIQNVERYVKNIEEYLSRLELVQLVDHDSIHIKNCQTNTLAAGNATIYGYTKTDLLESNTINNTGTITTGEFHADNIVLDNLITTANIEATSGKFNRIDVKQIDTENIFALASITAGTNMKCEDLDSTNIINTGKITTGTIETTTADISTATVTTLNIESVDIPTITTNNLSSDYADIKTIATTQIQIGADTINKDYLDWINTISADLANVKNDIQTIQLMLTDYNNVVNTVNMHDIRLQTYDTLETNVQALQNQMTEVLATLNTLTKQTEQPGGQTTEDNV